MRSAATIEAQGPRRSGRTGSVNWKPLPASYFASETPTASPEADDEVPTSEENASEEDDVDEGMNEYRPRSTRSKDCSTQTSVRGCKRRRITTCDENEDDEEIIIKPEVPETGPPNVTGQSDDQKSPDRRVKLVVNIAGQDSLIILVKTSTIDKIARLAPELSVPPRGSSQRQIINCSTLSGEEPVIQAIDFLESGPLAPLSTEPGASELLEQLHEKIKLFDISQELDIATLEIAVMEDIQEYVQFDADLFARFATACYDRAAGHRVERASSLGLLVKAELFRLMPEMIKSGIADDLRRAGGLLGEELADAVWERHRRLEQQRVARVMADRELFGCRLRLTQCSSA